MSGVDPAALAEWQSAIGRAETRHEIAELESLRRYALALGVHPDVETRLPPLAHWALFLPDPEDGALGDDGHPRRGGFLPAITLPRRMFAAAEMHFEAPLLVGAPVELVTTIADVVHKAGRSGDLVFVKVDRVISQQGQVCVHERQTYVYREAEAATPMPVPMAVMAEGEVWQPGAVNLFRFSAATFNSHRIHYDLPYAQQHEGYPALVVHGPFTAAKLAGLAERRGALARFSFRAEAPLFLGQPIALHAAEDTLRALRCDGATAMTAKVAYR